MDPQPTCEFGAIGGAQGHFLKGRNFQATKAVAREQLGPKLQPFMSVRGVILYDNNQHAASQ